MESRQSSTEVGVARPRSPRIGSASFVKSLSARMGAVAIAAVSALPAVGCGNEEERHERDRNECCAPVDPCERDDCYVDPCECPEVLPAPQIEVGDAFLVNGHVIRVPFTVPPFDTKRKAPLTVTILATLTRNPNSSASYGRSSTPPSNVVQVSLSPERAVSIPGESFVDGEFSEEYDGITSYQLVVTDNEGGEPFFSAPQAFGG